MEERNLLLRYDRKKRLSSINENESDNASHQKSNSKQLSSDHSLNEIHSKGNSQNIETFSSEKNF